MNGKVGRQVEAEITLRVESWCRGGKGNIGDEGLLLLFYIVGAITVGP